jgi:AcrR family transcriptional regulator
VAKGLLYNHFSDLDRFLAELILDRARAAADQADALQAQAGTGSLVGNLTDAAVSLLQSHAFAIAGMVHARPSVMTRIHEIAAGRPYSVLDDVEKAFAAYLEAEKKLGRIAAHTDVGTLAFVLVGSVHHIFMTNRASDPALETRLQRIVASLVPTEAHPNLHIEHRE